MYWMFNITFKTKFIEDNMEMSSGPWVKQRHCEENTKNINHKILNNWAMLN